MKKKNNSTKIRKYKNRVLSNKLEKYKNNKNLRGPEEDDYFI